MEKSIEDPETKRPTPSLWVIAVRNNLQMEHAVAKLRLEFVNYVIEDQADEEEHQIVKMHYDTTANEFVALVFYDQVEHVTLNTNMDINAVFLLGVHNNNNSPAQIQNQPSETVASVTSTLVMSTACSFVDKEERIYDMGSFVKGLVRHAALGSSVKIEECVFGAANVKNKESVYISGLVGVFTTVPDMFRKSTVCFVVDYEGNEFPKEPFDQMVHLVKSVINTRKSLKRLVVSSDHNQKKK